LLYTKGNKELLNTASVAIVGARKSGERSLLFTDNIAKKAVSEGKAVVSGFAKGVDRQALDSALKYNGKSIIVLPQGINTYTSKTYYAEINKGNVLVVSTYHPKARWATGLAMDRNKIIYGLADEIFVAESDSKGGTWAGVNDGLKKGRTIFIRNPEPAEKNANAELIKKGAVPVDMDGNLIEDYKPAEQEKQFAEEQAGDYSSRPPKNKITKEDLIDKVITELENSNKKLTISGIKEKFNIDRSDSTISKWLKSSGKLIHIKQRGKLFFDLAERKKQDLKLF
jgi:predicted Rossmann fold nucleotide-binding protein DprA/Smf involved in DNA uptake